ncbi:hypothetical protein Hypma_016082 [Hypsizygus marmoreus]|uniref:Uncharacterized protein n=1 Tax=Hypsizygus marmoreus TaxID=39966 RepID=A0A369K495_HYPMA|nr:hypothetical protein Hypma_016082 [Hypsizygus marmoreus]
MPYYGPDASPEDIFLERTFVAGDFVCGTGYGAQLVLYTSCAIFLWKTRKERRQSKYLLAYITLLLCIETLFMIVQARTVQDMYIDNRNYPGGPWTYFLATQYLPINVMFYATLFVLTFLSDLLVLWRCWVIWTASGRRTAYGVIALPALMILASFVMGTLWTLQSSQPGLSLYSKLPQAYGTSYYAISLSVNIILTILIMARLLMYRRTMLASLPEEHAKHYVSLATIMIESAALYSILAFIFIVTYAINNPLNQIFLGAASSGQQIAGYLIIYRLAEGRAWSKDTLAKHTRNTLPPMHFASKEGAAHTQLSTFQIDTSVPPSKNTQNSVYSPLKEEGSTLAGSPVTPIKERGNNIWSRMRKPPSSHAASMP